MSLISGTRTRNLAKACGGLCYLYCHRESAVAGSKPNDQDEAMIGVLRVAGYLNAVMMAGRLHNAQTIVEADSAERAFNRCARTVAILSETLMRMRSGCEQKATVENLSVNDNTQQRIRAQNVNLLRGQNNESGGPSPKRRANIVEPSLRCENTFWQTLHGACGAWETTLSYAWRSARIGRSAWQQQCLEAWPQYSSTNRRTSAIAELITPSARAR